MTSLGTHPSREEVIAKGQLMLQQREFESALSKFEEALAMGPPLENLGILLAFSAAQAGAYEKVMPAIRREQASFPHSPAVSSFLTDINTDCSRNEQFKLEFSPGGNYVLAGLSPDGSGTGRFLEALLPLADARGYRRIHPTLGGRFGVAERIKISELSDSNILLLHPQTIGWSLVSRLMKAGNRISFYVLDNSFFCIRSYNHRKGLSGECLDCVGNLTRCHSSCEPFPQGASKSETLSTMQVLKDNSSNVTFFCQSEAQRRLVIAHFGSATQAHVVGMKTTELVSLAGKRRFDVVYHAEELAAKGFWYTIELARRLPEISFLIPTAREELERKFGVQQWPTNITFSHLRWESGLEQEVGRCRMVLCPSLWSAAIEGAVLKSLSDNGNVAVVKSDYGFSSELPADAVLHLEREVELAAPQLRSALSESSRVSRAKEWSTRYLNSVQLERIFDILDSKRGVRI